MEQERREFIQKENSLNNDLFGQKMKLDTYAAV